MELVDPFMMVMERGGVLMWPLLCLSVITVAVVLERAVFWIRLHGRGGRRALGSLVVSLRTGKDSAALKSRFSPYAAFARELQSGEGADEATAVAASEEVRPALERGLVLLSTIVTAAPMLGILGTVLGIIESFELLGGDASINDPSQVSGGIAEALITTASGLVVALMALFPYMIFRSQQDRAVGRLESLIAAARRGRQ
jgi:biopolymer transport protein ExbB